MATVLVIDDEPDVRDLIARILRADGHSVLCAGDGKEGVGVLGLKRVDLAIVDMFMPLQDGIETVRHFRRVNPHIKIIAISGADRMGTFDVLGAARSFGADGALAKPFDVEALQAAVRNSLG